MTQRLWQRILTDGCLEAEISAYILVEAIDPPA
jgi:hypothetical protein